MPQRPPSPALPPADRQPWWWLIALTLTLLALLSAAHADAPADDGVTPIDWRDLAPAANAASDPAADLTPEQRRRLARAAIQRGLVEGMAREKLSPADLPPDRAALLKEDFSDVAPLLDQLQRARERKAAGRRLFADALDGHIVRLSGYVLPLRQAGNRVDEFLLVPFVGACIHAPPPPPNQILYVRADRPFAIEGPFTRVSVTGRLALEEAKRELYYVDGSAMIDVGYALPAARVEPYGPPPTATPATVSLAAEAALPAGQSWLRTAQYRASELLTRTLTNIRFAHSPQALLVGLLIAFAYGIVHTLGPGHGKAVVISYFVGRQGSLVRGIGMGCRIAFFHVISAIAIALLADVGIRQATGAVPSDVRWLQQISYAGIVLVGAYLLWGTARAAFPRPGMPSAHAHGCSCAAHTHEHGRAERGLLSLAVGAIPCSGAILILCYGLANDLLATSIALVAAISLGMAVAMSAIGVTAVYGSRLLQSRLEHTVARPRRLLLGLEMTSSLLVIVLGVLLFVSTLPTPAGS